MVFKINVSDKGKTLKVETDNEGLIRMKIGDKINGDIISADLEGYTLEITGTSDIAGFPGIKGQIGAPLRKLLLTKKDLGMNTTRPGGLRLKKSVRGEEISDKTVQINTKVVKEGSKKFADLLPKKESAEAPKAAA
jgi:ribosomal protein S6E (S10)